MTKSKTGNRTKKSIPESKIAEAALRIAARQGWEKLTLDAVARAAKIPLKQVHAIFPDKNRLLPGLVRFIDSEMLEATGEPDSRGSAHDRLFDIVMTRMDILQANRAAILSIMDAGKRDPRQLRHLLPAQATSMRGILKQAGLKPKKIYEPFVVAGLLGIYGLTLCAWRKDSSPDMSKTMAALDRFIRRITSLSEILLRRRSRF